MCDIYESLMHAVHFKKLKFLLFGKLHLLKYYDDNIQVKDVITRNYYVN